VTVGKAERAKGVLSGSLARYRTLLERPWLLTVGLATALCAAYLIGVFAKWGETADRSL
jgi:hypothetical protein